MLRVEKDNYIYCKIYDGNFVLFGEIWNYIWFPSSECIKDQLLPLQVYVSKHTVHLPDWNFGKSLIHCICVPEVTKHICISFAFSKLWDALVHLIPVSETSKHVNSVLSCIWSFEARKHMIRVFKISRHYGTAYLKLRNIVILTRYTSLYPKFEMYSRELYTVTTVASKYNSNYIIWPASVTFCMSTHPLGSPLQYKYRLVKYDCYYGDGAITWHEIRKGQTNLRRQLYIYLIPAS